VWSMAFLPMFFLCLPEGAPKRQPCRAFAWRALLCNIRRNDRETRVKLYRIAAIPGDGIGSEVIAAGIRALQACAARDGGFSFSFDHFDWGSEYYKKHGVMMPADGLEKLKHFDEIYFGAVGAPDVPDHVTLWGLRLAICQPFDQYANVRPTRVVSRASVLVFLMATRTVSVLRLGNAGSPRVLWLWGIAAFFLLKLPLLTRQSQH